jgi:hypothetical protein
LYLTVTIIGLAVYRPLGVEAVGAREIIDHYEHSHDKTDAAKKTDLVTVKQELAYTIACDAEKNQDAVDMKATGFQVMLVVFIAGLFSLVAALASIAF